MAITHGFSQRIDLLPKWILVLLLDSAFSTTTIKRVCFGRQEMSTNKRFVNGVKEPIKSGIKLNDEGGKNFFFCHPGIEIGTMRGYRGGVGVIPGRQCGTRSSSISPIPPQRVHQRACLARRHWHRLGVGLGGIEARPHSYRPTLPHPSFTPIARCFALPSDRSVQIEPAMTGRDVSGLGIRVDMRVTSRRYRSCRG